MLIDYKQPRRLSDGTPYQSEKVLQTFNCERHTVSNGSYIAFSGAMGTGRQVYSDQFGSGTSTKFAPDDWNRKGFAKFCKKSWQFWK